MDDDLGAAKRLLDGGNIGHVARYGAGSRGKRLPAVSRQRPSRMTTFQQ
jgi:hypothetical protein